MKLSTRFSLLSIVTVALSAGVMCGALLLQDYKTRQVLWQAEIETALTNNSAWSRTIHFRDDNSVQHDLAQFVKQLPVSSTAAAYHVDGEPIASIPKGQQPPRPERTTSERVDVVSQFKRPQGINDNVVNARLVVSVPILSPINPIDYSLTPQNYRDALFAASSTGPRFVVGYIEVATSRQEFLQAMADTAVFTVLLVIAGLAIVLFLVRILSRSIGKPLEHMAEVAHRISIGELPQNTRLPIKRNDEIGEIANVLNGVLEGVHKLKARIDVDRALLSIKVDSASKKLSAAEEQVSQAQRQIKRVAYYDAVTGLPNRRLMLEQLGMLIQIAAREKRYIGVILIDSEGLRRINETRGREVSDNVLRELAERIKNTLRDSDIISREETSGDSRDLARVGNDEFCVLLHGLEKPDAANLVSQRLYYALTDPIRVDGRQMRLDVHIGVALAPNHGKEPNTLMRAADVAMSVARRDNAQKPVFYEKAMDVEGSERFELSVDLQNADFDREMALVYQPQIDTATGEIIGAEALIRWNHPTKGMIPPFKFIPLAEESGHIIALGNWVLRRACIDIASLRDKGVKLPKVSINDSALQLTEAFLESVSDTLSHLELEPGCLELELTESLLVQNFNTVMEQLTYLHDTLGVRLSIDDFGTGYSSLAYLSRFPLDELKVDRSFVLGMEQSDNFAKITAAIIAMARQLKLDIVVEGVDSPQQYQTIREYGASVIQGYLFSRPLPLDDLETFIGEKPYLKTLAEMDI